MEAIETKENLNIIRKAYIFDAGTWFFELEKEWGWDKSDFVEDDVLQITIDFAILQLCSEE